MSEQTEAKTPIALKITALINYAGAFSAFAILWSIFSNPAGSYMVFNLNLHILFMGSVGSLLNIIYFGAGFFGGGLIILYFIFLALYCLLLFVVANSLLSGKKWSRVIQIRLSSIYILFSALSVISSIGAIEVSIKLFIILVNIFIFVSLVFNKKIKEYFLNSEQIQLSQIKKIPIILVAIIYVLLLTSLLFFINNKSQSKVELNQESVSNSIPEQEMVMTKDMQISAETPQGVVKIVADDSFTRTYTWGNCVRTQTLFPRKERWYGSLGAYFPGPNPSWKFCEGIDGALLEEGQMHFNTVEETISWINSGSKFEKGSAIYNNEGLLVSFSKSIHPSGNTGILKVSVWQLYINDTKALNLSGSSNGKITVK